MLAYLVLVFPAVMVYAAVNDLLTMTISNRLSVILVLAFAIVAPLAGLGWEEIGAHVGLALLVLVVGFGLFAANVLGGGDAKLLAAASLWIGWTHFLPYLVLVALSGGLIGLALLLYRGAVPPRALLGQAWALRLHERTCGIPYGIALAIGVLWIFPSTPWGLVGV